MRLNFFSMMLSFIALGAICAYSDDVHAQDAQVEIQGLSPPSSSDMDSATDLGSMDGDQDLINGDLDDSLENASLNEDEVPFVEEASVKKSFIKTKDGYQLPDNYISPQNSGVNPYNMPSCFFTKGEYEAIQEAKNSRRTLKNQMSESDLQQEVLESLDEEDLRPKPPPEEREISLGGVAFTAKNDWTFWFNGKRVTPGALPESMIELEVHDEYIEFKWFDDYTRQIYPIRLRPNQRFNLDTRIFLPG